MSKVDKKVTGTFTPKSALIFPFMPKKLSPLPSAHPLQNISGSCDSSSLKAWGERSSTQIKDQTTGVKAPSPLHLGSALLSNVSKDPKSIGVSSIIAKIRTNPWKQDDIKMRSQSETNDSETISSDPPLHSLTISKKLDDNDTLATTEAQPDTTKGISKSQSPSKPSTQNRSSSKDSSPSWRYKDEGSNKSGTKFSLAESNSKPPKKEVKPKQSAKSKSQQNKSTDVALMVCQDYVKNSGRCPLNNKCPKLHVVILPTLSKVNGIPGLDFIPSVVPLESMKSHYKAKKKSGSNPENVVEKSKPETPSSKVEADSKETNVSKKKEQLDTTNNPETPNPPTKETQKAKSKAPKAKEAKSSANPNVNTTDNASVDSTSNVTSTIVANVSRAVDILKEKSTSTDDILLDKATSTDDMYRDKSTSTDDISRDKAIGTDDMFRDKATITEINNITRNFSVESPTLSKRYNNIDNSNVILNPNAKGFNNKANTVGSPVINSDNLNPRNNNIRKLNSINIPNNNNNKRFNKENVNVTTNYTIPKKVVNSPNNIITSNKDNSIPNPNKNINNPNNVPIGNRVVVIPKDTDVKDKKVVAAPNKNIQAPVIKRDIDKKDVTVNKDKDNKNVIVPNKDKDKDTEDIKDTSTLVVNNNTDTNDNAIAPNKDKDLKGSKDAKDAKDAKDNVIPEKDSVNNTNVPVTENDKDLKDTNDNVIPIKENDTKNNIVVPKDNTIADNDANYTKNSVRDNANTNKNNIPHKDNTNATKGNTSNRRNNNFNYGVTRMSSAPILVDNTRDYNGNIYLTRGYYPNNMHYTRGYYPNMYYTRGYYNNNKNNNNNNNNRAYYVNNINPRGYSIPPPPPSPPPMPSNSNHNINVNGGGNGNINVKSEVQKINNNSAKMAQKKPVLK